MITIPIKYNISRAEWATIRAQLVVLGCPSKAVRPRLCRSGTPRLASLKHKLAVIEHNTRYEYLGSEIVHAGIPTHPGWFAQWMVENNLMVTHHAMPSRYIIGGPHG